MQFEMSFMERPKEEELEGKVCISCKEWKPYSRFSKHTGHKDNHDGRCRDCVNAQVRLRNELKKVAPPKPKVCSCCGQESDDIVIDHCHETKEFRGWICRFCNAGIGLLKDNMEGVEKALIYLRKHYDR